MNFKSYRFWFIGLSLIFFICKYYGFIRSKIAGMPYGITLIDRSQFDIPALPTDWGRFPKDNPLSALQIWYNSNGPFPKHCLKVVILAGQYGTDGIESNRYILKSDEQIQTDLVLAVDYKILRDGNDYRSCRIETIGKFNPNDPYNWDKSRKTISELTYTQALDTMKLYQLR